MNYEKLRLEYLTEDNIEKVRNIRREDIPERWVDGVDTILELTQYGLTHGCKGHTFAIQWEETYIGWILLGGAIPWETDPPEMVEEPFYRLMSFVLDSRYRNQGIGGYVLELAVKEIYREYGVRPIALGVHRENVDAARFYERHGFIKTDTMEGEDRYFLRYPYLLQQLHTYEDCAGFQESFYGDPVFSDPMLINEETLRNNLRKSFKKPETNQVLGVFQRGELVGLFSFLVLREEQYAEMLVGLSREIGAFREILCYVEEAFPGFLVDFVLNPRNHLLRGLLKEKQGEFEPEQMKMVLGAPVKGLDTSEIVLFEEKYAEQYFEIHNQDMYWTGPRVAAAPEKFRTLLAIHQEKVVGYIDVTHCFQENEPYDLFVLPEFREMGYGRKLLTKAIEMNQPKDMMLLVDVDNIAGIRLYRSVGFEKSQGPGYLTVHWKIPLR